MLVREIDSMHRRTTMVEFQRSHSFVARDVFNGSFFDNQKVGFPLVSRVLK